MSILPLDPADDDAIRGCHGVSEAAAAADDPFEPPQSARVFKAWLFTSWSGAPTEAWYVPGQDSGTVAAWCRAEFADLENLHWAFLDMVVHPVRRRAGLGTALLRHAAERAAMHSTLNDAPRDAGVEPHIWDAQQVRERADARTRACGWRRYSVAAMHDATGQMAALPR